MKKNLTEKQQAVLDYIKDQAFHRGYPPSLREIADAHGVSVGAIRDRITSLEKKNYIKVDKYTARGIVVL